MSAEKKKVAAKILFSGAARNGFAHQDILVLASDSDADDDNEDHDIPDLSPTKLSFEESEPEKSFLGRHEVTLFSAGGSEDDEEEESQKGLETAIVEEWESKDINLSEINDIQTHRNLGISPKKSKKKVARKRIIPMSSSSDEDEPGILENNEASFDLGAIKRQYETPKAKNYRHNESSEYRQTTSEDDYDFQDSFIDDQSLSSGRSQSCSEVTSESENEDEQAKKPTKKYRKSASENKETSLPAVHTVETKTFLESLGDGNITPRSHPDAVKYLKNYDRNKVELADFLFKLFNEQVFNNLLPHQMPLVWSRTLNKTAGRCIMKKIRSQAGKVEDRQCSIELATKVLTSPDRLRDTLIHELCHAAVWLINEINGGHGQLFQSWGKIATQKYPELPLISRCHDYVIETKFAYVCQSCSHHYKRHSKSIDTKSKTCGKIKCKNSEGAGHLKLHIWDKTRKIYVDHENPDQKKSGSRRPPNKFAVFVKDNYKNSRTPGKTHSEAMKELGQMFTQL